MVYNSTMSVNGANYTSMPASATGNNIAFDHFGETNSSTPPHNSSNNELTKVSGETFGGINGLSPSLYTAQVNSTTGRKFLRHLKILSLITHWTANDDTSHKRLDH